MTQIPRRLVEIWSTLTPARKAMLAVTGGAAVAMALLLYSWSSSASMVTLYSGLDAADSGAIVDQLRSRGVPYELSSGGATVYVPESQVDDLRVDFAAQGLPEGGGVGFEIFEGNAFTATDFVQRLNFQRGLQGELARTIESFDAVDNARVHIVLPERSLFVNDQLPTTASVVLDLRPSMRLSGSEIGGIARLVSGAVEGLDIEHVSILDTSGAVLYDGNEASEQEGPAFASNQLDVQRGFEQGLEHDAQALLDRSLGVGAAVVTVRAILDFDQSETERETYETAEDGDGVPRSTTSVEETYSTTGDSGTGAIPGAVANVPGADQDLSGGTASSSNSTDYSRTETTNNFEVGRTVTRETKAPGDVERLTVSLLLDEEVPADQVTPLTDAVAAAVGLDIERGDSIAVTRFTFDRTALDDAVAAFDSEASSQQLLSYVRMALPILLLIAAFIFFKLLMRSVNSRSYRLIEAPQGALPAAGMAGGSELPTAAPRRSLQPPPEADELSEVQAAVAGLVRSQPDTVTDVVQAWLRE